MSNEFLIGSIPDVGKMLTWLAKRLRLSLNKLTELGGGTSSSLIGLATGTRKPGDLNLGPVLRVLQAVEYELAVRPKKGEKGVLLRRPGAQDLMILGLDGGQLELALDSLDEVPGLLNTLAMANDASVSGLSRRAGLPSLGLVGVANGTSDNKDVRLRNLFSYIDAAGFQVSVRPVHATRRAARMALAAAYRG